MCFGHTQSQQAAVFHVFVICKWKLRIPIELRCTRRELVLAQVVGHGHQFFLFVGQWVIVATDRHVFFCAVAHQNLLQLKNEVEQSSIRLGGKASLARIPSDDPHQECIRIAHREFFEPCGAALLVGLFCHALQPSTMWAP